MSRQNQRSVLLTPYLGTTSNKRVLQESTESNLNCQSKKLEVYKAKLKASIQEKQQLQADHQRLVRRLEELERKNLEKTRLNSQSKYPKEKKQVYSRAGIPSSKASSKNFHIQDHSSVHFIENAQVPSTNQQNTNFSVTEEFYDDSTCTLEFLDSFKLLEIAEDPSNSRSFEDKKDLQLESSSKSPTCTAIITKDRTLKGVQILANDSLKPLSKNLDTKIDLSRAIETTTLVRQELSTLRSRKDKLEQEILQIKDELSKEKERRWLVENEHIQAKRKLQVVMNDWKLFYNQLCQKFLPECRNFLSHLKTSHVGIGWLQNIGSEMFCPKDTKEDAAYDLEEDMQQAISLKSFTDTKNSSYVSFLKNNFLCDSAPSFQTLGEQLDSRSQEPESEASLDDGIFRYSSEWSTIFNDVVSIQPTVRVACHKALTNLKNLDSIESKIKNVADKLDERITRLASKVGALHRKGLVQPASTKFRLWSDCTKLSFPRTSSEDHDSFDMDLANSYLHCQESQTKIATSNEYTFHKSGNFPNASSSEQLHKKVETLESKYGSLLAKILVQKGLSAFLGHEPNHLESNRTLRFLSLMELLLKYLEMSSVKDTGVLVESGKELQADCLSNNVVRDSHTDCLQGLREDESISEVDLSHSFCLHCQSLCQENRILKERIVELEEENSSLADRIF